MQRVTVVLCALLGISLTSCAKEVPSLPLATVNQDYAEYLGMTYQIFQERGGAEAQFYHANYFTAQIPGTEVTAVFSTSDYDADYSVVGLKNTDQIIRLQGPLGKLLDGVNEELTLETFAEQLGQNGKTPDFWMEEGGGTAYYIADRYVVIPFDSGEDNVAPLTLEVSLDTSEEVGPDSYTWLSW